MQKPGTWTPWRSVVVFGLVSLAADMVYEGMRAMAGPFLGSLGASALVVGLVTGAGEAVALMLRLVTGAWADEGQRYWRLTFLGYALTAVAVPLLAVAPFVGAAGLSVAAVLILAERTGKAIRSPAKSALLAQMATTTGRGRGFAVHKALDQIGAFAGPLLLAAAAGLTGAYWPGFALLALPGAASLALLVLLRRRAPIEPDAPVDRDAARPAAWARVRTTVLGSGLPRVFYLFSVSTALTTAGLMTFGVIAFELVGKGLVSAAVVPVVYAGAMAVEALAALATGDLFDRRGGRVLLVVPVLVAAVPFLAFADRLAPVLVGVALWGAATGIQDSTVKAYVADLVPAKRRATAYGVFAGIQGLGALAGGAVAGLLVSHHRTLLAALVVVLQGVALVQLVRTNRRVARAPG